ncbi:hypothetical protein JMJ35_001195 [Cladonia borealis]|uniref:Uncharacterized protein n=1 Tax=Cladonia borealis TaxID=184061 RepID=A0AA39R7X8_9LECA|nr:hypothetical protein JMJ35_001195 [Cladonia borealis]
MFSHIDIYRGGITTHDGLLFDDEHFDDEQETQLPYYRSTTTRMSERAPMNLTDCHAALLFTVRKARATGVKIAHRKEPLWRLMFKDVTLEGAPMEFDKLLFFIIHQYRYELDVKPPKPVEPRLRDTLRTLLEADKHFNESSARFKKSVLLIEENFKLDVIEPLKKALIDGSTPDYPNLSEHATHCMGQMTPAVELWRKEVRGVLSQIMESKDWQEATELNKKINDLLKQAKEAGWNRHKDKKFKELDDINAFQRPDGPSSIIAYLNSVLKSGIYQSSTKQKGPSTADISAGKIGTRREEYIGKMLRSSPRKKRSAPYEPKPSKLKRRQREGR